MWWILNNPHDQRVISNIYLALALALFLRPGSGPMLPELYRLANINDTSLIIVFLVCGVYLAGRMGPMYLVTQLLLLLPFGFFSSYLCWYALTYLNVSFIVPVFVITVWYNIVKRLRIAVEDR